MQIRVFLTHASFLIAGAAIGLMAWHDGASLTWLLLLPVLWGYAKSRLSAGLLWASYYSAGARDVPQIMVAFFNDTPLSLFGIPIWLAHAVLLSTPWILLWAIPGTVSWRSQTIRAAVALMVTILPPLGLLGWLSPAIVAGELFPGMGWFGMLSTLLLIAAGAAVPVWTKQTTYSWIGISLLLIATAHATYTPANLPDGWAAVSTTLGQYPDDNDRPAIRERQNALIAAVSASLGQGSRVVITPESIAGRWEPLTIARWLPVSDTASRRNAVLLIGADMPIERHGEAFKSGLVALGTGSGFIHSRVPMPVGMWRPWAERTAHSDWFGTGVVEIDGRRTLVSVCYEDYLIYPALLSLATESPTVVVSVANNWFASDMAAVGIQKRSIESLATLFNLPLLRALNTDSSTNSANTRKTGL